MAWILLHPRVCSCWACVILNCCFRCVQTQIAALESSSSEKDRVIENLKEELRLLKASLGRWYLMTGSSHLVIDVTFNTTHSLPRSDEPIMYQATKTKGYLLLTGFLRCAWSKNPGWKGTKRSSPHVVWPLLAVARLYRKFSSARVLITSSSWRAWITIAVDPDQTCHESVGGKSCFLPLGFCLNKAVGLAMRSVTWNLLPIKYLLIDSDIPPVWRLVRLVT